MGISKLSFLSITTLLTLAIHATPVQALNLRSFISANGSDTNSCARVAPCRTLQVAHDNTSPGGEINMLDPAGYGSVTITKAISIVNDGIGSAGILVAAGATGITINAGPNDAINIRGLIIEGAGVGQIGIRFNTGKSLTITNSVIRGLTSNGISFVPTVTSSIAVSNTVVANTGGTGIVITPSVSFDAIGSFSRVEIYNCNGHGISVNANASSTVTVAIADSVAANNTGGTGFIATTNSTGTARVLVSRSTSANNFFGVYVQGAGATLRIGQSTLTGNKTTWSQVSSGVLRSYQDNNIDGNDDGDPAPTTIAKK